MFSRTTDACINLSPVLHNSPLKFFNCFEYLDVLFLSNYDNNARLDAKINKFYFAISSVLRFTYAALKSCNVCFDPQMLTNISILLRFLLY